MEILSIELVDLRDHQVPNSVISTWKLSYDQIRKQNPRAAELLSIISVFDRQSVPEFILRKKNDSVVNFWMALRTLKAFALITANVEGKSFEMHRLVQLSIKKWLETNGEMERWKGEALQLLSLSFPNGEHEN